ncbi:phosphorylase family protein [Acetobacter thailandicus]|uniref:phosphorylase family protein n=1 Tax=Acetobacter thailandicus TaxID=1502842 RepID=UPI001BAB9E0D|nr:hypothetical protein [Acetobacter thailandicus]MBS0981202.1 hypothetical protein [Acetobacter thailandicus]
MAERNTSEHLAPTRPGILTGLKAEVKFLRPAFPHAAIAASGATSAGAQRETARLIATGPDCLLSFGLAAGLDPALPPGTVIVPQAVHAWGETFECDPDLRHILGATRPDCYGGTLLHSDDVVLEATEKARLFAETHCASLDMESGFMARQAREAGIPFAVLRVVCDPATRSLPAAAGCVLSPKGGLKIGALLASLARNPSQIAGLIALGGDAARARKAMQQFLDRQRTVQAFMRLASGN